jgi:N-acetylmuramoyl-L-alanine amidase
MRLVVNRRALFGLATLCAAAPARAADLTGLALEGDLRRTRFRLEAAGTQPYTLSAHAGPDRLVLHLPGAAWHGRPPRGAGLVRGLRWQANEHRIILDLAAPARATVHAEGGRLSIELLPIPTAAFEAQARRGGALADGTLRGSGPLPLVVLDAGHGGRDPGAIGASGTQEKRITLAAALELKRRLEAGGRCRVHLTRSRDVFVPLAERVEIARRRDAALFVSLHADSAPGARGASVYTLGETATDALSEGLARRENNADRAGGLRLPSVPPEVQRILLSLVRQETQSGSARIARLAVQELGESVPLLPNTHRQAGFVVLKSPETPSVLVEMGFLSDRRDEEALRRPEYRARVSLSLARAIESWIAQRGRTSQIGGVAIV